MSGNTENNKRIAKNTLLLYFRMMLTMAISLYTSRIVLNALGVEDFGIYNLVGGLMSMLWIVIGAMSSATQRFLTYEIGRNNFIQLKKTFNASLILYMGFAVFSLLIGETVGLWFVNTQLVIPAERMDAARFIFHLSVISFMISIVQIPFNALIVAHEKMNIFAYISILEVTLKLIVAYLITHIQFDHLKLYGILLFLVTFIITTVYRVYVRKHFKESAFEIVKDRGMYKMLGSYSGWSLLGSIAAVAKAQGIGIILNIFFGPIVNAAQGVAGQLQGAIQSFVGNFQTAVNPQIIKSYAADDREYLTQLIIRSAKFSFFLILILSVPVILEIDFILKLWLKTVPQYAASFTILILIVSLIDSISGPLITSINATGKIKMYQIVVGGLLIAILPISYLFLKLGYSPEIVYIVQISISCLALFMRLYFTKKLIDFPIITIIKEVILKNIIIVTIIIVPMLFLKSMINNQIVRLIVEIIVSFIISGITIYYIGLDKNEKKIITRGVNKILQRS